MDSSDVSGRCDWTVSFEQLRLTTNGKPGFGKRVCESEIEDNWCGTKRIQTWGPKI